jgi:HK97 family phage major capsid protein
MPVPIEIKNALDEIRTLAAANPQLISLQKQVDAIDVKLAGGGGRFGGEEQRSLYDAFDEDDGLKRLIKDKRGNATIHLKGADALLLQRKTTISEIAAGSAVSGVLPVGRLDGITTEARQQLSIRDLLTATPTTFQIVDFVKVASPMTIASPVAETSTKPENAVTFTTVSERVKTIATWIPASRQILDDMNGIISFVNNSLAYYLLMEEEIQLISGDNVGEDLHGLIPQAAAFNTGELILAKGWNKIDIIGRAIQQITAAKELPPTFIVMHPNDWWDIRLTKDGFGRYILGDPQQGAMATQTFGGLGPSQNLFGLAVDPTTNIAQGTFLVGSGSPVAAEIMDRLETQIDISTEHSTFFTQNLVAIRAEKRLALVTRRPGSFVTGTFTTSP